MGCPNKYGVYVLNAKIQFWTSPAVICQLTAIEYKVLGILSVQSRALPALTRLCGEGLAKMALESLIKKGFVTSVQTKLDTLGTGHKRLRFDTGCKKVSVYRGTAHKSVEASKEPTPRVVKKKKKELIPA